MRGREEERKRKREKERKREREKKRKKEREEERNRKGERIDTNSAAKYLFDINSDEPLDSDGPLVPRGGDFCRRWRYGKTGWQSYE